MMVSKAERLSRKAPPNCQMRSISALRTLQQDVEFGVLQIVDIALKAISPAVNDPTTAISCVDQLSRILIRFASRETPESAALRSAGRRCAPASDGSDFDRLVDAAFEQIRLYSKTDIAVSLRLLRALGDIAVSTADTEFRRDFDRPRSADGSRMRGKTGRRRTARSARPASRTGSRGSVLAE